jgi:NAD(P)-dependent dehydrogenase (short-subunit alcohol dehydrogenase family)
MMAPLESKVALVTGGSRGIGRSTAIELARQGASVAVLARSEPDIARVADEIVASGGRAVAIRADVARPEEINTAIKQTETDLGPVDILINDAGIVGPIGPISAVDPELWARTLEINTIGAYRCLRAVLPGMLARGWGRIVNISSGAATGHGMPMSSAYSVSKAALDMLTRVVAAEVASSGVLVNAVYPGMVDTAMQKELRSTTPEQIGEGVSAMLWDAYRHGRLHDPSIPGRLIAAVVLSDLHGQTVVVSEERAQQLLQGYPS